MGQQYREMKSSEFRTQIFTKGLSTILQKERQQFNEGVNKIPNNLRLQDEYQGIGSVGNAGQLTSISAILEKKNTAKQDISQKVEKMIKAIEEKLEVPDNNLVEESIRKSMFGIFSRNYEIFLKQNHEDKDLFLRKCFSNSNILNDIQSVILYFNLPLEIIQNKKLPHKIYPISKNFKDQQNTIQALLEVFEENQGDQNVMNQKQLRQANVIIMKVGGDQVSEDKNIQQYVIGGYASHGWSASFNTRGDNTCFLFNITQNLRFNAVKGKKHYQETIVKDQDNRKIKFGDTDLIISNDFKNVQSFINNNFFTFGNEYVQSQKINSIIPGMKTEISPLDAEVWSFQLY